MSKAILHAYGECIHSAPSRMLLFFRLSSDSSPAIELRMKAAKSMQSIIESNAASLRKLHETVHETFRHRSESPRAYEAWTQACHEFHNRWDELAFPGGLRAGLHRIAAGDLSAIETAIRYLELRPFYFRAQYTRNTFTRLIKGQKLPYQLQQRFNATRERLLNWKQGKLRKSPDQ